MPISGLVLGLGFAVFISQIVSLVHAARCIKINSLQLNNYAAIANPGARFFLCFIPLFSAFPLMTLYGNDPTSTDIMVRGSLVLRGDREAVKAINIHALDAPTTAADLLTHRMFLDSLGVADCISCSEANPVWSTAALYMDRGGDD
jgi:hypothetical protein